MIKEQGGNILKAIQLDNYGPVTGLNEIDTETPALLKKQVLVKKLVQIDFANPKWNAADHIQDIRKAVESASLNLFSRHDVRVELPYKFYP